jgi:hypothetical protein
MTIRPPGPDEPEWRDELAGRRASLTALWALALGRFRDYVHWAGRRPATPPSERLMTPAGDPGRSRERIFGEHLAYTRLLLRRDDLAHPCGPDQLRQSTTLASACPAS